MFTRKYQEDLLPQERVANKAFTIVWVGTKEVDHRKVVSPKLCSIKTEGLRRIHPAGVIRDEGHAVLCVPGGGL